MGYFQVKYDSRVINYNRRGFIRLATELPIRPRQEDTLSLHFFAATNGSANCSKTEMCCLDHLMVLHLNKSATDEICLVQTFVFVSYNNLLSVKVLSSFDFGQTIFVGNEKITSFKVLQVVTIATYQCDQIWRNFANFEKN